MIGVFVLKFTSFCGTAAVKPLGFSMDDTNGDEEEEEEPAVDPTKRA